MKRKITINKHNYYIDAYNTFQELKLIEFLDLNDGLTDDDYRLCAEDFLKNICDASVKISQISDIELILVLLKIREITIGTEVKLKLTCTNSECNKNISAKVDIADSYINAERENHFEPCNFVSQEYINNLDESVIPEDTDWDVYEEIKDNLKSYYSIYNLDYPIICPYCRNKMVFKINSLKKALTFISEESLRSIMSVIHDLTYYGHITRSDIMQMTPLERLMEISLLKKTKEKENPQTQ